VKVLTKIVLYSNWWTTKVLGIEGTAVIATVTAAVLGIGYTTRRFSREEEKGSIHSIHSTTRLPISTTCCSRLYSRSVPCLNSKEVEDKNLTETPTSLSPSMKMLSIASYLLEKIGSLVAWSWSSSVTPSASVNGRAIGRGETVELDEQRRSLAAVEEELANLKKLLQEARVRESENLEKVEELEALRKEVEGLRKEKGEEGTGVEDEEEKIRDQGEEDALIATISESEVVDLVKSLNQDILHLSEIIVKAFENVVRPPTETEGEEIPEELKEAFVCVEEILGGRMVGLLVKADNTDDGEVVRMSLKASMSAYTHWIISSWYFENPEDEHLLSEIYARVREAGECVIFVSIYFFPEND
jgi:hypothetical protein